MSTFASRFSPSAFSERNSAAEQLLTARANLLPMNAANSVSSSVTGESALAV